MADALSLIEDHLDMHFRQNRKANQSLGRGHCRSCVVVTRDGGVVVARDGVVVARDGVVVARDGGVVVARDGGVVVARDGGVVVARDGGVVVAGDGGVVVARDGGVVVAGDGVVVFWPVYELAAGLHSSSTPTPSKKATAALANISLDLPTKPSDDEDTLPVLTDYRKRSVSPDSQDAEDKLEELRKKFVGEIDLPESEEPLLKESKRHFVLFPIQYHKGC
ncbi:hypothetical protein EDD22DRAFT_1001323 [Suillus occidentalis]|nr:hypothetical protein EDD22DRAFT_1001323 [Suillus occidentalis]